MAVLQLIPITGSNFNIDHKGKRQYTRKHIAVTDSDSYEENVLIQDCYVLGLPRLFTVKSITDPGAVAAGYSINQIEDCPTVYEIDVVYQSHLYNPDTNNDDKDKPPIDRRSKVSFEATSVQWAVTQDLSNPPLPLVNSADEPYKGVTIEVPCLKMNIEQYQLVPRQGLYVQYFNAINSDNWQGFDTNTVRCSEARAVPQIVEGFHLYVETFGLVFNPLGWKRKLVDQGFRTVVTTTDDTRQYTDIRFRGQRITTPVFLDGTGHRLAKSANPVFNSFTFNQRLPFNALGIPR